MAVKNILIIGKNSYIGTSFARYAGAKFHIHTICAKDNNWRDFDFSSYDTVLHCAGIAHIAQKDKNLYYSVNCNLAVEVAKKAKAAGVGQFVFLSSMSVYGNVACEITPTTKPNPSDYYGGSKLAAEEKLSTLASSSFSVCILRPPMVYGYGCKGNFPRLVKLAERLPVFPNIQNQRSMIYIDNLCEFICQVVLQNKSGIHTPQNTEYVNTTELVRLINGNIRFTKIFNPFVRLFKFGAVNKLFGNLIYTKTGNEANYNIVGFENSIKASLEVGHGN